MPRTTLVAGTTITASWANANVRDQVITPFASAAARDSSITSPIEGQYAHLNDVNYLSHYDGTDWVRSNHNIVKYQELTANSAAYNATTATDFQLASVVFTANRLYRVTLKSAWVVSAAATYTIEFWAAGAVVDAFGVTDNLRDTLCTSLLYRPTAGTKTLEVRVTQVVAGGSVTFVAAATQTRQFWVEDIGPR